MTMEQWQTDNSRYLSVSLRWLRLRLEQMAETPAVITGTATVRPGAVDVAAVPAQPNLLHRLWRGQGVNGAGAAAHHAAPLLLEDFSARPEQRIAEAQAERQVIAAQMQPPPALLLLGEQLGLTSCEQDLLLLCAAMDLDTQIPALCARAQDDPQRPYPTFALALALFDESSWELLSPDRPLRYWRLIEISQPGATPLTASALRADERIVNYLKGLNLLDDRLATLLWPLPPADGALLSASQQAVAESILWHWQRLSTSVLPVAQLLGADPECKRLVAQVTAGALGRHLFRLDADALPAQPAELENVARLWLRESQLLPLALLVDAQSSESGSGEAQAPLLRFLSRVANANSLLMLAVRDSLPRLAAPSFALDVARPSPGEQEQAWRGSFEQLAAGTEHPAPVEEMKRISQHLAGQFSLNYPQIFDLAADGWAQQMGRASAADGQPVALAPLADHLWAACRSLTRPRLDTLAQRLNAKATWDDLVLPDEPMRLLRLIAAQVQQRNQVYETWGFAQRMNRGMGISALFSGESGTGKTMAAEVIANDLRLNLYRIDLSAVVSKYIGETEKNLRRLFDAAEEGGAILFFDEADALFGKRSEVKDSHDRYANIEINYLLQRMEAYGGLAILATNMKSALDSAFLRRLRFIVHFSYPGIAERMVMWQKAFPPQTPRADLDYERLARLNLSGGNIHSVALNAAFLAAQVGEPVTMPLVMTAARMELRKLEKPFNEADLRR
jgi:hypothetical protein